MSGLHLMINAELSLFQVHDITNASATKMAIEKKKRNISHGEKGAHHA